MSERILRLGLIGCGPIAQWAHCPALMKTRNIRLTALCDAAEDLLALVGDRMGVEQRYARYDDFLEHADIDAVLVAVSDPFHVALSAQALRAGKHVLVEKPLGVAVAECEELVALVESTGLKLQVGSMKRHDVGVVYAREFIRERLGGLFSVSGWYCDSLLRSAIENALLPPIHRSSRGLRPKADPKADLAHYSLTTHGAHLFDMLRFLAGPITGVTVRSTSRFGQHAWHGLMEFADGVVGHFELSVKVNDDWREGYRVYGKNGAVHIKTFLPYTYRSSEVKAFDASTGEYRAPMATNGNAYRNQLEAFADAILNDRPVLPDAREGLAAVRVLEAVEASVRENKRIAVLA